jgi:hypothetical protein
VDALAIVIGVDVGQRVDPTAIAVIEPQERDGRTHHVVRFLDPLPLGTPYPKVTARLAGVVASITARKERRPVQTRVDVGPGPLYPRTEVRDVEPHLTVYVDATGVGLPVVDQLAEAGVRPIACFFTHGDRRIEERETGEVKIGKAWLVSRLQVLLQTGRLHLPATPEAKALAKELQDYEITVDEDANDKYGAFRVGTHDDLVTALGLAVQPAVGHAGVTIL